MKYSALIIAAFIAVATASYDEPKWKNEEHNHSDNQECASGEGRCTQESADYCVDGKWVVTKCLEDTKCLGHGSWSCVAKDKYDTLEAKLKPTYEHYPQMDDVCVHGDRRCTWNSTDLCNHGKWTASPCVEKTRCLACSDYECVHDFEYAALEEKICALYEAPKPSYKCSDEKTHDGCTHGEFRCGEDGKTTDRCNHGNWFAQPCAADTKCLECGDFECIANDQYEARQEELCPNDWNGVDESKSAASETRASTIAFIGAAVFAYQFM